MLTVEEIQKLLELIRPQKITLSIVNNKIVASHMHGEFGYSDDDEVSALQAKLSIMLAAAAKREELQKAGVPV